MTYIAGILIGFILSYLATDFYNSRTKNKTARKNLDTSINKLSKRVQIQNEVNLLRKKLNCSRVSIINYDSHAEAAFMKYESCEFGFPEIIESFQNMKTTKCLNRLLELERRGFVTVDEFSDNETKELHAAIGVVTSYKYKILNTIDDGCLVISYSYAYNMTMIETDHVFQTVKKLKDIYAN